MMTVADVKKWISRIKDVADDDEVAHTEEDRLHQEVLAAIADGAPNAAELAREALKTSKINFSRWCA